MQWKTAATLYLLAPFGVLWIAFIAVEARRALVAIRRGRK
jgi:hypothetical protein